MLTAVDEQTLEADGAKAAAVPARRAAMVSFMVLVDDKSIKSQVCVWREEVLR
jgi:hypothetical protein